MTISDVKQMTLPGGEKANPKTIASKVNGMFVEEMLKSMESTVDADSGLFSNSNAAEIYRGMFREKMAASMSASMKSPFDAQFEKGMQRKMPKEIEATPKDFLKSGSRSSDTISGKDFTNPIKDGPGAEQ